MTTMGTTKPTKRLRVFGGTVAVDLFGRETGDWRTRKDVTDLKEKGGGTDKEVMRKIGKLVDPSKINRIFMPRVDTFNARVCDRNTAGWTGVKPNGSRLRIMRGVKADAVILKEGEAGFINSGGCPTMVVLDKSSGTLVVSHAGRESLYDKGFVDGESATPNRPAESVVFSIFDALKPSRMSQIFVFITCGIAGKNFRHPLTHPQHGKRNARLISHLRERNGDSFLAEPADLGMISLRGLIVKQCVKMGVPRTHITCDNIDTYEDRDVRGNHLWWDHRRDREHMTADAIGRNGVLVYFAPPTT